VSRVSRVPFWLQPAVSLLNRLSFLQKFAVISFFFALPLGLSLWFLNNWTQKGVRVAQGEVAGVRYLTPLQRLHEELPQARSLARAYLQGEPYALEHYPMRQSEVDVLMGRLEEIDRELGSTLGVGQSTRILVAAWTDLKGQLPKLSPEISDAQFDKLQADVMRLMALVGDRSKLILDPDLDSYYLMDAILLKLPENGTLVTQARQQVANRAIRGERLTDADFNVLATLAGQLRFNVEKLERGMQVAFENNPSGTVQAGIDQPFSQYLATMQGLLRQVEETFNESGREAFNQEQFLNSAALVLTSQSRLWDRLAGQLTEVLEFRIARLHRELWTLLGIAIFALILVSYLWWGFYRSITGTVQTLQEATERMRNGREDIVVELAAKDELGKVGEAFNDVARQLAQSSRNYRSIFEGSVDGIFRTSLDGRYLEANDALAKIYKYSSKQDFLEKMGVATGLYVLPERREDFRKQIEEHGVVIDFEAEVKCADGSKVWINENARLIRDENGQPLYYEGLVRDITEKKKAEKALRDAMKDVEAASRSKSEFLANVSHEIRTPMNAILGFSELLVGLIDEPRQKSYLQAISSSGRTLLALINDILDLSKIEAGKLNLEYEAVDVEVVMRDVQHIFSQKAEQKGIDLVMEVAPGVPPNLLLDEVRLRQILFNCVGNALKFTEAGSVTFRAAVSGSEVSDSFELVLEVIDTGIGIPVQEQQRIFEAFSQQTGQSQRRYEGTGLGLTITRRLTEMMNGRIELESVPGKGSTFRFIFPEVHLAGRVSAQPTAPDREQVFRLDQLTPSRILVVDDVVMNRDLIRAFFHKTDHVLLEAANGREALSTARAGRPDLILMDVRMPVMDGVEATRLLKSDPDLRHIPVIIVTASAMQREEAELKPICEGFLRKPISRDDLAGQLRRFLKPNAEVKSAESEGRIPALEIRATGSVAWPSDLTMLKSRWEELSGAPVLGEVEAFARELRQIAELRNHAGLEAYADRLADQARSFAMAQMEKTLSEFKGILRETESRMLA
jgi:PAS domain S-box-containing protein